MPGRRAPVAGRPRDGDPVRAPLPGLARGLPAHRPARLVLLLRGLHPHRRFDVQPARQVAEVVPRHPVARARSPRSTILLTSHVWRQDHNGFSHQDPGFIDLVVNKKADVVRVYLPPDANTLLCVADHCLRSRNPSTSSSPASSRSRNGSTWTRPISHCEAGIGIWEWASNDARRRARRRDGLRGRRADARDAGRRRSAAPAPAGAQGPRRQRRRPDDAAAAARSTRTACPTASSMRCSPRDRPVIFAYPRLSLAHPPAHLPPHQPRQPARARLQGGGHDHDAVRHGGAQRPRPLPPRDGRRSTACRARVQRAAHLRQWLRDKLHRAPGATSREHGEDMPEVRDWTWPARGT